MIQPYPLQWPDGQKRSAKREKSRFQTTLTGAMKNVTNSLRKFADDSGRKLEAPVITSNAALGSFKPDDPGIAVWFAWDGDMRCIAVDRYDKVECNLQAIYHVLEARRTELRHAGIEMVRTTFKGFIAALPAPDASRWWQVLGVAATATEVEIQRAYKERARSASEAHLKELNIARDQGRKERAA